MVLEKLLLSNLLYWWHFPGTGSRTPGAGHREPDTGSRAPGRRPGYREGVRRNRSSKLSLCIRQDYCRAEAGGPRRWYFVPRHRYKIKSQSFKSSLNQLITVKHLGKLIYLAKKRSYVRFCEQTGAIPKQRSRPPIFLAYRWYWWPLPLHIDFPYGCCRHHTG